MATKTLGTVADAEKVWGEMIAERRIWWVSWTAKNPDVPDWACLAAVDLAGTFYIAAAVGSVDEAAVVGHARGEAPTTMIEMEGHFYMPTEWLAREFPASTPVCRWAEAMMAEHFVEEVKGRLRANKKAGRRDRRKGRS